MRARSRFIRGLLAASLVLAAGSAVASAPASRASGTPQTISFVSSPSVLPELVGNTYTPVATASSGLPVTFTIDASSVGCSLSGGTVHFDATGTCVIDADQPGDGTYAAAPQVQQSIVVAKFPQTITFFPPQTSPALVGTTYQPQAISTSGLPVFFSIDATSTGCSISFGTVTFNGVGTCVIDADQPGNPAVAPAPQVQQSIPVVQNPNQIFFTPSGFSPALVGDQYTPQAFASSLLPVVFSIDASSTGCVFQGGSVFFLAPGTCVIDANQSGNVFYAPAVQVQQSIPVVKRPQTITFTAPVFSPGFVGGTYMPQAFASSPLAVVFSIDASSTGCTLLGGLVTFTGVGTCVIDANQSGDATWGPAPQVQQSIPVVKRPNTITFTTTPPFSPAVVGTTYTPQATAASGRPVLFSIDGSSHGCSLSGGTVFFTSAGTCVVDANEPGDTFWAAAPQVQQSITVVGAPQTLSFTTTPPVLPAPVGTTYTPHATATSGLPVVFTIDGSSTGCSLTAGLVTFTSAGTCVVDANQPGDTFWAAAPQVQQSITVVAAPNVITFTTTPSTVPAPVGTTYTPAATATSGLPVAISLDATSTGCSISGGVVTFTAAGTCVIDANQAGNALYAPAAQVQQSIPVVATPNTITFTTSPSTVPAPVGGTYMPQATATSGLPVTISLDAASTGCSLTNGVVTFTGAGTCVIDANQPGNAFYAPAPQVQQSIPVAQGTQTISFTSPNPTPVAVGDTYTPAATATSGLPVAFTLDALSTGCTVNGLAVHFTAPGTCVVDANQPGNANYAPALQVQQVIIVKLPQTITFTSTPPAPGPVGGTYVPAATATSGLLVAFTLDATSTGCSLSGGVVTFTGVGTCIVDANQGGNPVYAPAPQVQQAISVGKGAQAISFTSTPPAPGPVGGTYRVAATATSGLTVSFTRDAASTGCSLSGKVVTFTALGICVIDANQAGNADWAAAPQVQQTILLGQGPQTITFTSTPPSPGVAGGTYIPTATATSGLPVAFTLNVSSTGCSLAGGVVTFTTAGTCIVAANQPGNASFSPAPQVLQSIAVKLPQTISFTSTAASPPSAGSTYTPTATATSGLPVSLSLAPSSTGCSMSGGVVTFKAGAGTCIVNANQAGNTTYLAAPQVQQSIGLKRAQTISFTSTPPSPAVAGRTYRVAATATSGLPVAFTLDATSTGCSLSGGVVTFTGLGTCVIAANQAGNARFSPAPQVQQSIAVKLPQTISFTSTPPSPAAVGGTYTPAATATSGLAVVLTLAPTSTGCSLSGGVVTFTKRGTCIVVANQAGNANWAAAPQVQQSFAVKR